MTKKSDAEATDNAALGELLRRFVDEGEWAAPGSHADGTHTLHINGTITLSDEELELVDRLLGRG